MKIFKIIVAAIAIVLAAYMAVFPFAYAKIHPYEKKESSATLSRSVAADAAIESIIVSGNSDESLRIEYIEAMKSSKYSSFSHFEILFPVVVFALFVFAFIGKKFVYKPQESETE